MARNNKIHAGPYGSGGAVVKELPAAVDTLPGQVLTISGGQFALAGAGTNAPVYVAQENYLAHKKVSDLIAAGDTVAAIEPGDRDRIYVLVPTGNAITDGAALTTDANGKVVPAASGNRVIFLAEEAYNNNTGEDQLVLVRYAGGHLAQA